MRFLSWDLDVMTVLCLLLFMGAMGKSAQFLLHTWLPDAMEGPTPVSALIHAATMVTAGVFMVARLSPLFEQSPTALLVVTAVGTITAFFAATVGLVQNDIKRVVAYSTCSQLGYMFAACGVGAYNAGIFHLFTHAFFKALLFLGAGSVIHAMHHEQDMQKMGGLAPKIRFTWWMMLIGTVALTGLGIPGLGGTAGFHSKDAIIEAAYEAAPTVGTYAFWLLVIAAFMTSFYSWRLIFLTFHGPTRADHHTYEHAHESPPVMLAPLAVLAAGALFAGLIFQPWFLGSAKEAFWRSSIALHGLAQGATGDGHGAAATDVGHGTTEPAVTAEGAGAASPEAASGEGGATAGHGTTETVSPAGADTHAATGDAHAAAADTHADAGGHHVPLWVAWAPTIAMAAGFLLSWLFYIKAPSLPDATARAFRPIYLFLYNKWYFDELYDWLFVRPARWLGRALWKGGDGAIIDGLGPDGVAARVLDVTKGAVRLQTGYVYHYAFVMLIGVTLIATVFAMPPEYRQAVLDWMASLARGGAR
jgi:NADH-quinone oxidoreductase subunit L